jgi:hypothetical protein
VVTRKTALLTSPLGRNVASEMRSPKLSTIQVRMVSSEMSGLVSTGSVIFQFFQKTSTGDAGARHLMPLAIGFFDWQRHEMPRKLGMTDGPLCPSVAPSVAGDLTHAKGGRSLRRQVCLSPASRIKQP